MVNGQNEDFINRRFRRGVLSLPTVAVDDSSEYSFLNMIAFEKVHVDAGNDVTAYVYIYHAKHDALLTSKGIIQNFMGNDEAVAKLFRSLPRDLMMLDSEGPVHAILWQMNRFGSTLPWEMWFTNFKRTYFKSPWAFMSSLAAAAFLLIMSTLQTVYTMLQFYGIGAAK